MSEEKYIAMDEFDAVDYPDSIVTGGLGPCFGIGVFDRLLKRGYLLHLSSITAEEALLDEFIKTILDKSEPADLDVLLTGLGVIVMNEEDTLELQQEKEAERQWSEKFITSKLKGCELRTDWPAVGYHTNLEVHTNAGKISVSFKM